MAHASMVASKGMISTMRSMREARGLSIEDVAFNCGVIADDIRQLELGNLDPPLSLLRRYAAEVGVFDGVINGQDTTITISISPEFATDVSIDGVTTHVHDADGKYPIDRENDGHGEE
jgi:transcriptional regulator with XRE-family HTH domain